MNPVFIGGCGRSGTTLLTDLLGCHSAISPIYEPWFLFDVARLVFLEKTMAPAARLQAIAEGTNAWMRDLAALPHNKAAYERYRHGEYSIRFSAETMRRETERLCRRLQSEASLSPFRDFAATLFDEHAKTEGKPFWASKVPRYVLMAPLLKQAFPEMRFVHCVRDPRATIASMASRDWAPKTLEDQIEYWRTHVGRGMSFVEKFPRNAIEVRYEDLVADPVATMSRLFAWLGVADEAASLVADYRRDFQIEGTEKPAHPESARIAASLGALMARYDYA